MKQHFAHLAIATAIFVLGVTKASAADNYAYCSGLDIVGSTTTVYSSPVFPIPLSAITFANSSTPLTNYDNSDPWHITIPAEPASSFTKFLTDRYSVTQYVDVNCYVFRSASRAQAQLSDLVQSGRTLHEREISVNWTYTPVIPMRQATYTSLAKPTEADALYDAETHVLSFPPFENNKYLVIHRWDKHECDEQTKKTMVYGHPKTTTTYTCTVTYSYSETASPLAKTAIGNGSTQDEAAQNARSTVNNAHWSQPFCSKTFKAKAYQSKPSYKVGDTPEGSDWWVCAVEYTVNP